MTASIDDIRSTYGQLRRNEEEAQRGIARLREDLVHAREHDVQAYADAALAGQEPPKRKEVTLRHKIDNLEVALEGYEVAHGTLLEEAIIATGAGRRGLSQHEQHLLRDFIIPRLTEEQKRELWQRGEVERA
jgi:hypothetical protein